MKARSAVGLAGSAIAAYVLVVRGALTLDLGVGRRTRPLGPLQLGIAAAPELVFDIIAAPYLGKTPRAMEAKLRVLDRGSDMVLAEHYTDAGLGLTTTTVETVRFERPYRISFRLLRGPVPYVRETFELAATAGGTALTYSGQIGGDFWRPGEWWTNAVARRWVRTVEASLAEVVKEAGRRAGTEVTELR